MVSGPITSWQTEGEKVEVVTDFLFLGSKIIADGDCSHEIRRRLLLGRKMMTNLDNVLKSRDIPLPTKVRIVKAMIFPMFMYSCESWTVKKQSTKELMPSNCGAGEDFWKSLRYHGDQTSQSKGKSTLNTHWKDWCWNWSSSIWSPDVNSWLIDKVPDAGKDWGQKEKRTSEDEMTGWHHWGNGHELGQTLGDGEGPTGPACCSPWGHKELDTTGWLNNNSTYTNTHI